MLPFVSICFDMARFHLWAHQLHNQRKVPDTRTQIHSAFSRHRYRNRKLMTFDAAMSFFMEVSLFLVIMACRAIVTNVADAIRAIAGIDVIHKHIAAEIRGPHRPRAAQCRSREAISATTWRLRGSTTSYTTQRYFPLPSILARQSQKIGVINATDLSLK